MRNYHLSVGQEQHGVLGSGPCLRLQTGGDEPLAFVGIEVYIDWFSDVWLHDYEVCMYDY
jgi:hypothetical protein